MIAERRGVLVIVSSPSGAGKTTLTRRLLGEFPNLTFSVSYTTRSIRPGERDGVDYHFVDTATFEGMVERGEFAEHATVHGNRYGTAKAPVDEALHAGRDVIFDVDWQGGRALSAQWPEDSLRVFILPPDLDTLAHRLRRRATDAPEVIERRLRKAIEELGHFGEYENLIVNDELDRAYGVLRAVYLCRSYGEPLVDGRAGVPYPLGQLAGLIAANQATSPDAHARQLIAAGS
jgi:guanylate kinase